MYSSCCYNEGVSVGGKHDLRFGLPLATEENCWIVIEWQRWVQGMWYRRAREGCLLVVIWLSLHSWSEPGILETEQVEDLVGTSKRGTLFALRGTTHNPMPRSQRCPKA